MCSQSSKTYSVLIETGSESGALILCFDAFSSREPVPASLENALFPSIALETGVGIDDAAVDRDGGADDVIARAGSEIDRGPRHVLIGADAPRGNVFRHLVGVVAGCTVRVRLERPRAIADTTT